MPYVCEYTYYDKFTFINAKTTEYNDMSEIICKYKLPLTNNAPIILLKNSIICITDYALPNIIIHQIYNKLVYSESIFYNKYLSLTTNNKDTFINTVKSLSVNTQLCNINNYTYIIYKNIIFDYYEIDISMFDDDPNEQIRRYEIIGPDKIIICFSGMLNYSKYDIYKVVCIAKKYSDKYSLYYVDDIYKNLGKNTYLNYKNIISNQGIILRRLDDIHSRNTKFKATHIIC